MSLFTKKRKSLLALIALLVLAGIVTIVIYSTGASSVKSGNTQQAQADKNSTGQSSSVDLSTQLPIAPEQNQTGSSNTALPPISVEVANEIRKLSNHTTDGLVQEKNADGSVSMDLQGHFQSVTAAVRGPDGKIIVRHGEDFLPNIQPENNASPQ